MKFSIAFSATRICGHQADVVDHVSGSGDAQVLMPTGSGKSLCFQIPALLRLGVVLSPLTALMQDKVDTECRLMHGEPDLVYVAPERRLWQKLAVSRDEREEF